MTEFEQTKAMSQVNLDKLLKRLSKFKIRRTDHDVDVAMASLPIFHCVRPSNILEVIKSQEIKVKNQVVMGEHTNMTTDFFQGFDNHLSMSIGTPWVEYGPYTFAYGLNHIDETSLVFNADPWLWGAHKMETNVLIKDHFVIYAKELLRRNLYRLNGKIYIPIPIIKPSLHWLAKKNFRKWELKQAKSLSILECEEFIVWSGVEEVIYKITYMFGNPLILGIILFTVAYLIAKVIL